MHDSWHEFIAAIHTNNLPGYEIFTQDSYLLSLLERAEKLNVKMAEHDHHTFPSAESAIFYGIGTAFEVSAHLMNLLGDKFNPQMITILSKTRKVDTLSGDLNRSIGEDNPAEDDYAAIDLNHSTGLNLEILRRFGLGEELVGCPAAVAASKDCMAFLKRILPEFGISDPEIKGTMLKEFVIFLSKIYKSEFRDWYDELSAEQREDWIKEENRRLLEGEMLSTLLQRSQEEGYRTGEESCPYPRRGKEG
jgi:hypothetical protein